MNDPVSTGNVRSLTAADSVRADGASVTEVVAEIDARVPQGQRVVTFNTTVGKFVGSGTAELKAPADAAGRATAVLQAPAEPTTGVITASAGGGVSTRTIRFYAAPPALRSLSAPDSLPADGGSVFEVVAVADTSLRAAQRVVTFTTTAGRFVGTTATSVQVPAGADGRAAIALQAPAEPARAVITASLGGTILTRTVRFTAVAAPRPQSIQVTPSLFAVKANAADEITVTAVVRRASGAPLPGVPVTFAATDTTPERNRVGFLTTPAPTNENGMVTVRFAPARTPYRGRVLISATVRDAPQVTDTTFVYVVDP